MVTKGSEYKRYPKNLLCFKKYLVNVVKQPTLYKRLNLAPHMVVPVDKPSKVLQQGVLLSQGFR